MVSRAKKQLPKEFEDLISQSEAAELRGVSRAAIGYLIESGRLHVREILGRRFVYRSEVVAFVPNKPGPKASAHKKRKKRTGKKKD